MTRSILGVAGLAFCLLVCGCSGKPSVKKYAVHGVVTIDKRPLADGEVYFKTIATGALDIVLVKDGKFEGNVEAGNRRIEIYSFQTPNLSEAQLAKLDPISRQTAKSRKNTIPAKYNTESKQTAEVKTSGDNTFEFAVTSK
jgi:hypothetical protein